MEEIYATSKRNPNGDYFAAEAMNGLIALGYRDPKRTAAETYDFADATAAERAKRQQERMKDIDWGQRNPSAGNEWLSSSPIHPHLRGFQRLRDSCE